MSKLHNVHDVSSKKILEDIVSEISNNKKYKKHVVSVFQVGSTADTVGDIPKYEDNDASDIDLIFVFDNNYLVKHKDEVEKYIANFRDNKLQVWVKSNLQYQNPNEYFKPGAPAANFHELDGWDGLARQIGLRIEVTSGKTIYGNTIIEKLRKEFLKDEEKWYVPPEEGQELITVAIRDELKGLTGRNIESGIETLVKEGINEEKARKAFYSYLDKKRNLPKTKQRLTEEERAARDYILTKDNDMAKAALRAFLGFYIQLTGKFISTDPHEIYSAINKEKEVLISGQIIMDSELKRIMRDILQRSYEVKVNNSEKDILWEWDWTGKNIDLNKNLVDRISMFFKECLNYTSKGAYIIGYTQTQDFQNRLSYHLARRSPGIIEILSKLDDKEFNVLENITDLYINEIIGSFSNKLDLLEDRLSLISNHRDAIIKITKKLVEKYTVNPEIGRLHKDKLLQLAQLKLLLAQQEEKKEVKYTLYLDTKNTLEEIFRSSDNELLKAIIPPRKEFDFTEEALTYALLGEVSLELNKLKSSKKLKEKAIEYISKSISLNPRDVYPWRLLSKLDKKSSEKYDRIINALKNPEKLIELPLFVDSSYLQEKLYSPWQKVIEKQVINDSKTISRLVKNIAVSQYYLLEDVELKEDNVSSIIDYLLFLQEEKKKLVNVINSLFDVHRVIGEINGENYLELEKIITEYVRKEVYEYNKRKRKNSLKNTILDSMRDTEGVNVAELDEEQLREYIEKRIKISFIDVRDKLRDLKDKEIIDEKTYQELYSKTQRPLPDELFELKEDLEELLAPVIKPQNF